MDFVKEIENLKVDSSSDTLNKFNTYYEKLIEVNSYMNLTAVTEKEEVYNKHFLDSLTLLKAINLDSKLTLLDVGSGAGFPAIPLAIARPNLDITIIDALNKRIKFLNDLVADLKLNNVKAYHKRAEEYAKEAKESFDVVTARAVARLNVLAELCIPFVKIGGFFVAMKAMGASLELTEALKGIKLLGGEVVDTFNLNLPDDAGMRSIIVIKKVKETPAKYPRSFAKIKEKPL